LWHVIGCCADTIIIKVKPYFWRYIFGSVLHVIDCAMVNDSMLLSWCINVKIMVAERKMDTEHRTTSLMFDPVQDL
jgi:hypothetical protein